MKSNLKLLAAFIQDRFAKASGYSLVELVMVIMLATVAVPAIVSMYTTVYLSSHDAEFMTIAELLAVEQMEKIIADKAGVGAGFGYANINSALYSAVDPPAPFTSFGRTVTVTVVDPATNYEYKQIEVTVTHALIPPVILVSAIMDHPGL